MDDTGSIVGLSAGGGVLSIILYFILKLCYKKEMHTKIKSGCCETQVDIEDNSSPIK
jgi:hypothetical protein